MAIPEEVQVDAILTGKIWNIVHRYCNGEWGSLSKVWTVKFQEIVNEAKRRGLENFVSAKPISEGYWLLQVQSGYLVCYMERGTQMYPEEFSNLELAFLCWLKNQLKSHQLPVN